jgi:hypothetical protein
MLLGFFGGAGGCESALAEVTTLQAFEGKILIEIGQCKPNGEIFTLLS